MAIRILRGMSQSELCDRIAVLGDTPVTVSAESLWESGKRQITATHMHYLAAALEVTEQDLFDWNAQTSGDPVRAVVQAAKYSEHERAILRYAALDWDCDSHALIEMIGAMISLPPEDQAEGYNYMMWVFEKAAKEGRLMQRPFEVDTKMLHKKIDILEGL